MPRKKIYNHSDLKSYNKKDFDYAINGVPFLSAVSTEFPYQRESVSSRKEQFDTSAEAGEQSLQNWWYRSQASFDLGAGAIFADTLKDENLSRRCAASWNLDLITTPGETTLLNPVKYLLPFEVDSDLLEAGNKKFKSAYIRWQREGSRGTDYYNAAYWNQENAIIIFPLEQRPGLYNNGLILPKTVNIVEDGSNRDVYDIIAVNNYLFFLSEDGVHRIDVDTAQFEGFGPASELLFKFKENLSDDEFVKISSGILSFVKDRLVVALTMENGEGRIYQLPVNPELPKEATKFTYRYHKTTATSRGIKAYFKEAYNWKVGLEVEFSGSIEYPDYYNTSGTIVGVSADKKEIRIDEIISVSNLTTETGIAEADLQNTEYLIETDKNNNALTVAFPDTSLLIPLYRSLIKDIQWTGIAEGPTGIYFTYSAGNKSAVLFSQPRQEFAGGVPILQPPSIVAELPTDETALSLATYLGTYIIVGTNKGVRVGIIDGNGGVILGELTLKSDKPVRALYVEDRFVYAGGALAGTEFYPSSSIEHNGLYKIDLSRTVTPNSLSFAWQKDINEIRSPISNNADINNFEITYIGPTNNNKKEFVLDIFNGVEFGKWFYVNTEINKDEWEQEEAGDDLYITGYLKTGKIRFDTTEDKIFQYINVSFNPPVEQELSEGINYSFPTIGPKWQRIFRNINDIFSPSYIDNSIPEDENTPLPDTVFPYEFNRLEVYDEDLNPLTLPEENEYYTLTQVDNRILFTPITESSPGPYLENRKIILKKIVEDLNGDEIEEKTRYEFIELITLFFTPGAPDFEEVIDEEFLGAGGNGGGSKKVFNNISSRNIGIFYNNIFIDNIDTSVYNEGNLEVIGSDLEPRTLIEYTFMIGADVKFTGYQVKATPSNIKNTIIQLPVQCFAREKPYTGPMIERPVFERIKAIESAEQKAAVVLYQDLNTGEEAYALIERVQFINQTIPDNEWDKKDKGGILILTLRLTEKENINQEQIDEVLLPEFQVTDALEYNTYLRSLGFQNVFFIPERRTTTAQIVDAVAGFEIYNITTRTKNIFTVINKKTFSTNKNNFLLIYYNTEELGATPPPQYQDKNPQLFNLGEES